MSNSPNKFKVTCPGCSKQYLVPPEYLGKTLSCQACSKSFRIPAAKPATSPAIDPASSSAPIRAQVVAKEARGNCGVCQCEIAENEPAKRCPACAASYHLDCWDYNHGCGVYGCSEAPPTEGLNSLEIPPSHWGQEEKKCPQCARVIKAAAVRCRHCGAVFETANPQDQQSFQSHRSEKLKLPMVKIVAVILLVTSLIPCTAPIAAFAGTIWYALNYRAVAMLPPFHSALCKIAIGVSYLVTLLLITFAIINLATG